MTSADDVLHLFKQHARRIRSRGNGWQVCACGWRGFPHSDHQQLMLAQMLLQSDWARPQPDRIDQITDASEAIRAILEERVLLWEDGITKSRMHSGWAGPIAWELAEAAVGVHTAPGRSQA